MKSYRVLVSFQAEQSLKIIYEYIQKESPTAASYVKKSLIALIRTLKTYPEKFSKEELLAHRKKNYRSVTKWHYKIIYLISGKDVIVLDIIHTSRNPRVVKEIK